MSNLLTSKPDQGYINHIGLVLDASGSMASLADQVVRVADNQVVYLAETSKTLDQETRATVYSFDDRVRCVYYDKDVLRLPSLKSHYKIGGMTALIDATYQCISDLEKTATLYGDHAFLIFVVTDGMENASTRCSASQLKQKLTGLPNNWTVAALVPNQSGVMQAKNLGFAPGNIQVWDATSIKGLNEGFEQIRKVTEIYMTARSSGQGVGSFSRGLFNLDTSNLNKATVQNSLMELHPGQYRVYEVGTNVPTQIAPFIETATGVAYKRGSAFYELVKSEKVQPQKAVAVMDKKSRKVYTGSNARSILGLPNYEVKVSRSDHPDYDIFIQSTSVNRKLVPGEKVLLLS